MKYMGSKRSMLQNGLGDLLRLRARRANRVVDLFSGSGSVSWFAAQNTNLPVLATDLQSYAVALAKAVVGRDAPLDADKIAAKWLAGIKQAIEGSPLWPSVVRVERDARDLGELVTKARLLCEEHPGDGPIWQAYGGYYFSPRQALTLDCMLKRLPTDDNERSVCLASMLSAATKCAAAPGHTAQPFKPNATAGPFLREAWTQDPALLSEKALRDISPRHARVVGEACIADALQFAATLGKDDLVIVDPPYSGVQYSRFYHVLETIARGACGEVGGIGRYPPFSERPQSDFSKKSRSKEALETLLSALADAGSTVIVTFPDGQCSNGLSGDILVETARKKFSVKKKTIHGRFSTLGGNNDRRASRNDSSELLLLLRPL